MLVLAQTFLIIGTILSKPVRQHETKARHALVLLLIILVALSIFLDWFPQIQNNSLIVAASILSALIEIYGFIKERSSKDDFQPVRNANQTNNGPGSIQQQIEYYEQALKIAREIGDRRGEETAFSI